MGERVGWENERDGLLMWQGGREGKRINRGVGR